MSKHVFLSLPFVAAILAAGCSGDVTAPQADVPTITIGGAVYTVSGDPAPSMVVTVTALDGSFLRQTSVGADGRFTVEAPDAYSFDLRVEQPGDTMPVYLPTLRHFAAGVPDGWQARVLLIPSTWTIQTGDYAGYDVPVSLDRIYHPRRGPNAQGRLPMWPVNEWPEALVRDGDGPAVSLSTVTWPDSLFPIPLFIERDSTAVFGALGPVTAADSALLWDAIADMERRVGMDLFRPVREDEVPVDTLVLPNLGGPILRPFAASFALFAGDEIGGGSTWACYGIQVPLSDSCRRYGAGAYVSGSVSMYELSDDPAWIKVLQHELLHVLGLGHSCFEPSIMSYCQDAWLPGWRRGAFDDGRQISTFDVAYFHLLLAAHRRAEELRPHLGLLEALQGERVRLLGEPRLTGRWWEPD